MRRKYPSFPLVGGVLVKRGDSFLLVRRGKAPGKGLWSVPGGLVELGERVREAGKREVVEETGLEVEIEELLDVIDNIVYDGKGRICYHYVLIDFLGHTVGGALKIASDITDARWAKIDEISRYPLTKTLERLLEKLTL